MTEDNDFPHTNGFRGRVFSCHRLAPSGPDVYRNRDSIMLSSCVGAAPNITPTGLEVVRTILDYKQARPYGADTTNSAGISDFLRLLEQYGPPPKVIWLTCGNTSNARLKEILNETLEKALELLQGNEQLVEISAI